MKKSYGRDIGGIRAEEQAKMDELVSQCSGTALGIHFYPRGTFVCDGMAILS
jgi:hypothetical protein